VGVRGYGLAASDHASAKMTLISLDDHDGKNGATSVQAQFFGCLCKYQTGW